MLHTRKLFLTLFGAFIFYSSCATSSREICGGRIRFSEKNRIHFNSNEEPLLCGDEDREAWKNVPLSQSESALKSFLRVRGYFKPEFELSGDSLIVDPGPKATIENVEFSGEPPEFLQIGYLGWKKRDLSPETLDEIEGWTRARLHTIGYACAQLELAADPNSRFVRVQIRHGKQYKIPENDYEKDLPLRVSVLERYHAFETGESYDLNLLTLTSRRMEGDDVVSHSAFLTECADEDLHILHQVSIQEPRLLRIAAGISTEEFPILRSGWKSTRLGKNASNLTADFYVSQLRQEAQIGYKGYFFEQLNRSFYQPILELKRVNEKDQEFFGGTFYHYFGTGQDLGRVRLDLKAGPALSYERSLEGRTEGKKEYLTLETRNTLQTQDYEVYVSNPRSGAQLGLSTSSLFLNSAQDRGSHRIELTGTQLWNFGRYEPPQLVAGYRFGIHTVLADAETSAYLPADFLTWLGGERDVRGFGRHELGGEGVLSSAFLGTELRAPYLLPKNFDPFIFMDFGWLGRERFQFDSTLYWSPGVGLRWQSPIGTLRTMLAHGYVAGPAPELVEPEHLQFFLSLGGEF